MAAGAVRATAHPSTSATASAVSAQSRAARSSPSCIAVSTARALGAPYRAARPPADPTSSTRSPACGPEVQRSCPTSPAHSVPIGTPAASTCATASPVPSGGEEQPAAVPGGDPGRPLPAGAGPHVVHEDHGEPGALGDQVADRHVAPAEVHGQPAHPRRVVDDPGHRQPDGRHRAGRRDRPSTASATAVPDGSSRGVGRLGSTSPGRRTPAAAP